MDIDPNLKRKYILIYQHQQGRKKETLDFYLFDSFTKHA